MNISEKVAYLKGLMSGLAFDESTKEAKMFNAIIDALDDISMSLTDLEENQGELEELVTRNTSNIPKSRSTSTAVSKRAGWRRSMRARRSCSAARRPTTRSTSWRCV